MKENVLRLSLMLIGLAILTASVVVRIVTVSHNAMIPELSVLGFTFPFDTTLALFGGFLFTAFLKPPTEWLSKVFNIIRNKDTEDNSHE